MLICVDRRAPLGANGVLDDLHHERLAFKHLFFNGQLRLGLAGEGGWLAIEPDGGNSSGPNSPSLAGVGTGVGRGRPRRESIGAGRGQDLLPNGRGTGFK